MYDWIKKSPVPPVPLSGAGKAGFSLIELVVVVAILSTLLGIAWLPFHAWQVNRNVEAQVRQMVSDISELRILAITRKQRHSITLNTSNYVFKSYTDNEIISSSTGKDALGGNHPVSYPLLRVNSGASTTFNGMQLEFDPRGAVASTLLLDNDIIYISHTAASSPSLDCINLKTVRTNPGKLNSTWSSCDDR